MIMYVLGIEIVVANNLSRGGTTAGRFVVSCELPDQTLILENQTPTHDLSLLRIIYIHTYIRKLSSRFHCVCVCVVCVRARVCACEYMFSSHEPIGLNQNQ